MSSKYLQGQRLNHFPGQPVPMLDNPLGEEKLPNIQSKPPLAQLEAISSHPITCYLGEETDPHLSTTSFQAVVESNKVSPQPPFLQAKQPQFPQPLLISLVLQTLHQLRCPSLDTLQHLNVSLVVKGPKLNTVFEVWPHQRRVQGHDLSKELKGKVLDWTSKWEQESAQGKRSQARRTQQHKGQPKSPHTPLFGQVGEILSSPLRGGDSTTSLGSLFQCLTTLSVKKFFLIPNLSLPWCNLRPFPLILSLVTWERDRPPPLYNLLSVVESNKVSPQPPFLQAKQSQLPQLLLIRLLLQTLHQLRCPSLDMLQHLNVSLVVGGPKLNTVFEVRPHQCRVQGHDHFPSPAGHAIFDTSQDAIGFLGRLGTLLAHIQAAVNQHSQVLFCLAAFQPLFPKSVALHVVVVTQVQDPALGLVEPHTVGLSPSIQPAQIPLSTLPHNLVSSANLLRVHSIPSSRSLIKMLNRTGPNTEPWGTPLNSGPKGTDGEKDDLANTQT
ncbi:LOW QUALITY PROTEIN: hypothetical protein QYF61_013593 [Mycteria americana]|uniref:Uncharacterized protein n=1 Tax=Mycteria americana TaxID=33587 RepID=A0AAN7PD38_MYCAM|nr:LOW QUALITY PROTEIN: hypothetical protein QYF61_013593 [Mycteria americana]